MIRDGDDVAPEGGARNLPTELAFARTRCRSRRGNPGAETSCQGTHLLGRGTRHPIIKALKQDRKTRVCFITPTLRQANEEISSVLQPRLCVARHDAKRVSAMIHELGEEGVRGAGILGARAGHA